LEQGSIADTGDLEMRDFRAVHAIRLIARPEVVCVSSLVVALLTEGCPRRD